MSSPSLRKQICSSMANLISISSATLRLLRPSLLRWSLDMHTISDRSILIPAPLVLVAQLIKNQPPRSRLTRSKKRISFVIISSQGVAFKQQPQFLDILLLHPAQPLQHFLHLALRPALSASLLLKFSVRRLFSRPISSCIKDQSVTFLRLVAISFSHSASRTSIFLSCPSAFLLRAKRVCVLCLPPGHFRQRSEHVRLCGLARRLEQARINPAEAPCQVDASAPGHGGRDGASHGTTNCTLLSSEDMENSSGQR